MPPYITNTPRAGETALQSVLRTSEGRAAVTEATLQAKCEILDTIERGVQQLWGSTTVFPRTAADMHASVLNVIKREREEHGVTNIQMRERNERDARILNRTEAVQRSRGDIMQEMREKDEAAIERFDIDEAPSAKLNEKDSSIAHEHATFEAMFDPWTAPLFVLGQKIEAKTLAGHPATDLVRAAVIRLLKQERGAPTHNREPIVQQTPLFIEMLLHYHTTARPYADRDPEHACSPAVFKHRLQMIQSGLLFADKSRSSGYRLTPSGEDYVRALLAVKP
jgi:hypothetical protein